MPFSSPAQTLHVPATTATIQATGRTPFIPGENVIIQATVAGDVASAVRPPDFDEARLARFKPGATDAGDDIDVPDVLNAMDDQAIAGITTPAIRMRVVLVKNPEIDGGTVLTRVGNDETPSTGEFCQTDTDTLNLGDATLDSDEFDLYVFDADDIATTTLVAGAITRMVCPSFLCSDGTAVADLYAVART